LIVNSASIHNLKEHVLEFLGRENIKIVVFGSRARGNNITFSDVDIGINMAIKYVILLAVYLVGI